MMVSDVASIVVALATTISLIYIARQVNVTRQQTKGQFLLALDAQFEKTGDILMRMLNDPAFTPDGVEWTEVWKLMSIFERVNIMVEDKILDVDLVDRLYGFRLLGLIGNDAIYQRVQVTGAEWRDFIDLCHAVADHRQKLLTVNARDRAFIARVEQLNKQTRSIVSPSGF